MAFLDKNEREQLYNELKSMSFNRARGKLRRIDPKGRLAYLRNVQNVGEWVTRYELPGLGTRVTLVESFETNEKRTGKIKSEYTLVNVIVEPTPENKT